ncbi:MAG: VOC family protein [Chloroflexota bacterium]
MLGNNLNGFQHLGLPVTDIDASKAFYTALGFTETMYRELPTDGDPVRISMLELNDFTIELYQLTGADLENIKARGHGHVDHFALDVNDIEAAWETVHAAGYAALEEKPVYLPFWEHGVYYFNIQGPDGEKVEFNCRLKQAPV